MDQYADDLAVLFETLDLTDVVMSVIRPAAAKWRSISTATAPSGACKAVLIGAVLPLTLKTDGNPGGLPLDVPDGIRKGTKDDRAQFYYDLIRHDALLWM